MKAKRTLRALSAAVLFAGSGVLAPGVFADTAICGVEVTDDVCTASTIEQLELGLANSNVSTINTSGVIVFSGEGNTKTLVINKDINGQSGYDMFHVEDGANLTLRGNGTLNSGRYGAVADGADLIIDGVTINATTTGSYGVFAKDNGHVTIQSGQVNADYAAFAGNNTTGDMNFYIEGGILHSNRYPAIYMPGQVDLVIRGGTLDGGIVARMGQIMIEGGTINAQSNPVAGDGLDVNYNGMPSMAGEAITLIGGSYKSTTTEFGNDMNVTIDGDNVKVNGDIALYDLGNTATGYEQDIDVIINRGTFTSFTTKFTEGEIGFSLNSGYTAGLNNAFGRVNVEISGGNYTVEPAAEDIIPENEAELNEETGVYEILPKQIDWAEEGFIETNTSFDDQLDVIVEFGEELIADRKASLSAILIYPDTLTLDESKGGELLNTVDITMFDRDGAQVDVRDNHLSIIIGGIDEETRSILTSYDKLYVVYFNNQGQEEERYLATLEGNELIFETTHLSTYGVVGVNETSEEGTEEEASAAASPSAPDTGTMTAVGASAYSAVIITALVMAVLTSIVSFCFLYKRLVVDKK